MEKRIFEYVDRSIQNYVGIGTFIAEENPVMKKGDKFIYPGTIERIGFLEGRKDHPGYKLPILLTYKAESETHILSKEFGAIRKDLVFREIE